MTIDYAKHKNILLRILKEIYSDVTIAPHLGFKGGTAAYLFYNLNRSSVDLDFDLLDESKEAIVFERIKNIAFNHGKIIDSRIKRFNLFNVISYDTKSQNIKIEINRKDFGSHYKVMTLLGIPMLVMVKEDMFAHKLMAMYERFGKTSRDIYDVWFFLNNDWEINKSIIEQRSGMPFNNILKKCTEQLERMDNKNILVGLGESLNKSQKDWAREKLRTDTIFLLKARLESEKI